MVSLLKLLCEKFQHTRFEPSGFTGNQEIPIAKSLMDYIFRWMEIRFVSVQQYPLFKDMVVAPSPQLSGETGVQPPSAAEMPQALLSGAGERYTTPPQGGLASNHLASNHEVEASTSVGMTDRCIYHAADAMKELVEMGDAPICHVCGSIMTRNGSCYRCMSCGSTSGCS